MLRKCLIATGLVALMATQAQAGLFGSLLSGNGIPDLLLDDSASFVVDRGGDADVLEVGDLFQGAFELGEVDGNSVPAGTSIFGVFSLEVLSIDALAGVVQFGAPAAGADNITSLLSGGGVDMSGLVGPTATTGITLIESTTADLNTSSLTAASLFADFGANGFEGVLNLGFDGIDDHHTVTAATGVDLTDLAAVSPTLTPVNLASIVGTYSVTADALGPVTFLPLPNAVSGAEGAVVITNGTIQTPTAGLHANGFLFGDDGTFAINVVPEPTSLAAWIVLAGFAARRRRR